MKTNHILAILALVAGMTAAFTNHSKKNELYPDWKFQKEQLEGKKIRFISAHHLADLIYAKKEDLIIFDVREWLSYEKYHIPPALPYDAGMGSKVKIKSGTIVLYGEAEDQDLYELARDLPGRVFVLKGGMEAWYSLVLFPDFVKFHVRNNDQLNHILRRSKFFGGTPQNTQLLNIDVRESRYREGC
ncbi:MAG: rhodanese-like domain-containing protein [Bacteroidota bacterium]|nr:rhodanese-like domain-containing protein [Bacteroidota bacterium]